MNRETHEVTQPQSTPTSIGSSDPTSSGKFTAVLQVLSAACGLTGAAISVAEGWIGLGWVALSLIFLYSIWFAFFGRIAIIYWHDKRAAWRALKFALAIVLLIAPLPLGYPVAIDHILLPESSPAFKLTTWPYSSVLVALPSQTRTLEYFALMKCGEARPCEGQTTELNYSVILFEEIGDLVGALSKSNLKPQISFAPSWLDKPTAVANIDPREEAKAAFKDQDLVVIGGPISTAYFYVARQAIVAELQPNQFSSLPIDFSAFIYAKARTPTRYGADPHAAVVTRYDDTISNVPALSEDASLKRACVDARRDYFAIAVPANSDRSPQLPCPGGQSIAPISQMVGVAADTHEDNLAYRTDWAFFVIGPNPGSPKRQMRMIAGLHAEGSRCALRYLLDLKARDWEDLQSKARDLHTDHGYVTGLLRCEFSSGVMKARELVRAARF